MLARAVRALPLVLALACAAAPVAEAPDSAVTATPKQPTEAAVEARPATRAPAGEERTSEQRQRFEEFARRSRGDGGDMEATFEAQAAQEMEQRRAEALARGRASMANAPDLDTALLTDDILSELARDQKLRDRREPAVGRPEMPCFPEDPGPDPDWVRDTALQRSDFLKKKKSAPSPVAAVPGGALDAWLHVGLACVLALDIQGDTGTQPTIQAAGVRWQAFARRSRSWWNGESQREESDILAHQQLHLKLAQLFAGELEERLPAIRERTRTSGGSLDTTAVRFRQLWQAELDAIALELQQLIAAYDRQTKHGTDDAAQRLWASRIRGGIADVRGLEPL
jgi:hypothetical protein